MNYRNYSTHPMTQAECLEARHTPTPWITGDADLAINVYDQVSGDLVAECRNKKDAAFIAKAANAYKELIDLAEIITSMACPEHQKLRDMARHTLKKIGEQS